MRYYTIFCWPKQKHSYCLGRVWPLRAARKCVHRCLYLSIWTAVMFIKTSVILFFFLLCRPWCYTYGIKTTVQRGRKTVIHFLQPPTSHQKRAATFSLPSHSMVCSSISHFSVLYYPNVFSTLPSVISFILQRGRAPKTDRQRTGGRERSKAIHIKCNTAL